LFAELLNSAIFENYITESMTINIQRTVIKIQLRRFLVVIVFVTLILAILLMGLIKDTFIYLTKYQWSLILAIGYLIYTAIDNYLEPYYIYFNDESSRIILRFFSLGLFNKRKQVIEIPKNEFVGFEVKTSFFHRKEKIILIRRVRNQNARYPAVSLSALSKQERKWLYGALNKISD
jgi:hypothetical protein